jgi:hypothetical protein
MIVHPVRYGIEVRVTEQLIAGLCRTATRLGIRVEIEWMEGDRVFALRLTSWAPDTMIGRQKLFAIGEGAPYPWCNWEHVFPSEVPA